MLRLVYDTARGQEKELVEFFKLAGSAEFDDSAARDAYDYLRGEELIHVVGHGLVWLTHAGVKEVEASIQQPASRTEHFSTPVIQQVTNNFPRSAVSGQHLVAALAAFARRWRGVGLARAHAGPALGRRLS